MTNRTEQAELPDPIGAFLVRHGDKIKVGASALLVIAALAATEWKVFGTRETIKGLSLAAAAWIGFYGSEIAKKAVRARQVANQAWAYVVNFHVLEQLEPGRAVWAPLIAEWVHAIDSGSIDRLALDIHFREKVFAAISAPNVLSNSANHFQSEKLKPGRVSHMLELVTSSLEELRSWSKYLSDEDIALLGPEILFEATSYRASQINCLNSIRAIYSYLRDAENPLVVADVLNDLQRSVYFFVRAAASLERLKTLVPEAKARGLLDHTKQLLGS